MQYVSIYRLAELCDVNIDRLDIFSTRDIQSALKKLYASDDIVLYEIDNKNITLKQANDFLWKANSSDTLTFCQWVHDIPGLEFYLETNKINPELNSEIPNKVTKAFNFARFSNFLADYLEPNYLNDVEQAINERQFNRLNFLLNMTPLLMRHVQYSLDQLIKTKLIELEQDLKTIEQSGQLADISKFTFLGTIEFKKFMDALKKEHHISRSNVFNSLNRVLSEGFLKNDFSDQIVRLHNLEIQKKIDTPEIKIVQDVPVKKATKSTGQQNKTQKSKPASEPRQAVPKKPKTRIPTKTASRKKVSPFHFIAIGFAVFALIFKVVKHNTESSYDYDSFDFPDYSDSDFGSEDYLTEYNWDANLATIIDYVEEHENISNKQVSALDDWYDKESEEAISEPFGEFFYPLYNKDGADGFNIINKSNYAVIILVQGASDCYSYFVKSKSSYEEYFDLEKDDEIMFYFGKEFQETEDLDESEIAGFHFVDQNTKMYLDSVYTVGFGVNPDRDNEDESFDYEIKITEKNGEPVVSFDYYRTVKTEKTDLF